MALKKQEFYEGVALHLLIRHARVETLCYQAPFFVFNERISVYLKYTTKARSPWGFTFVSDEQAILRERVSESVVIIGLICGADGVAALTYDDFSSIVKPNKLSAHIACYRAHGEYYGIKGPGGELSKKVPPSDWRSILEIRGNS